MLFGDLKHAQRERLIFLDQCFAWRGVANRRDLTERFGVSNPQAALDFKIYIDRAGEVAPVYDAVRKTYVAAPNYPGLSPVDVHRDWERNIREAMGGRFDSLPKLNRLCEPAVMARLYQAIENAQALHIKYTSMKTGQDAGQWIAPMRFASDGERLHLRAYSFKHKEYRDYIPVRIGADSSFRVKPRQPVPHDNDWHTLARIFLRPKSSLSSEQAEAVRHEYGFVGATLCVETRKALEFYADARWGLNQPTTRLERERVEYMPLNDDQSLAEV